MEIHLILRDKRKTNVKECIFSFESFQVAKKIFRLLRIICATYNNLKDKDLFIVDKYTDSKT